VDRPRGRKSAANHPDPTLYEIWLTRGLDRGGDTYSPPCVLFAYVFLLAILRASGKRTIAQGTTLDFVVALVLGDLIDDALWAEVPGSM